MARLQYDPKHDYYNLLDIAPDADEATIQRLFRQKAKQLHPDVNPSQSEWAKEQFQQINAAYRVLSNPETRQQYDELRRQHKLTQQPKVAYTYPAPPRTPPTASSTPPSSVWRHPPRQSTTYQRPVYTSKTSLRNPYRFVLMFAGVVLLINIGFAVLFLSGTIMRSILVEPTVTPAPFVVQTPTITLMPTPTLSPFESKNTCEQQSTILAPDSRQYGADDMPLPLSVRITRPSAFTYEVGLYAANDLIHTLKRPSTTQESFTGERISLPTIDLSVWGVGDYELLLTVYDQNQQELVSCSVLVRYVEN